ncbi:MAG: undecaprenyldiphospho-muramoylpentapeptide beta-N-acetylglucosaminyltransferase, partial [Flavobacteriales bacterium]|nr:undecaprenyldiphospho-muramoylpentapeptide beta-N-acetylglucosaminyltransferase [Flavobacteriales bacterium]
MNQKPLKVIISGGGTGGHIFPAIAIAKAILAQRPDTSILFVGAEGRMEMEKVPAAGFNIEGLPIIGIQRRLTWKNLLVPIKLWQSLRKARRIIRTFQPDIAIGVGGYASGPLLKAAASMGVVTMIQEQNSSPGVTNKLLARKAAKICVAYEGLEKFFDKNKIVLTGNPVRPELSAANNRREEALKFFHLDGARPIVLVIGGSLGARTVNQSIQASLALLTKKQYQLIWQTGKAFASAARSSADAISPDNVRVFDFIREMDLAYSVADVVVSRAGAMSISELCIAAKPAILVPSPNVSEDHQTKNARSLSERGAAILVPDIEAKEKLG